MKIFLAVVAMVFLAIVVLRRCRYFCNRTTAAHFERGYAIVLPGIEGASFANSNIAQGLCDAGIETAVEVDDWTSDALVLFVLHLRHRNRHRREARRIAAKIVAYQDQYPGRPVHLLGHSGGGGLALLVLECLPPGRKVTGVILLAPALSPRYDLQPALERVECGIWNFYSPFDLFFLVAGTLLAGTIDGRHTPAAGAVGFAGKPADSPEQRALNAARLRQICYHPRMAHSGNLGGHFGGAGRRFSRDHLAPLLREGAKSPTGSKLAEDIEQLLLEHGASNA